MESIRYKQRICTDYAKIEQFLREKRVGTLSMCDLQEKPYAVPVNYVYWNDQIYIHGLGSGKKNTILAAKSSVCFTVFEEFGTVTDILPAKCDTAYFSVVIFGTAVLLEDMHKKTRVLDAFLDKFVPRLFQNPLSRNFVEKYRSELDNRAVAVYEITPEWITAKENPVVDVEHLFLP